MYLRMYLNKIFNFPKVIILKTLIRQEAHYFGDQVSKIRSRISYANGRCLLLKRIKNPQT